MAAICSVLVYSCSTERDEEITENHAKSEKLVLKKLKTSNNQNGVASKIGDSTVVSTQQLPAPGDGLDPLDPTNPDDPEIIPPGDVKPPK